MEAPASVRQCRLQRRARQAGRRSKELSSPHQAAQGRERGKEAQAGIQSQKVGRRANPLMAEPISKTTGQLRKDRRELRGSAVTGRSHDLLEADHSYSRISS